MSEKTTPLKFTTVRKEQVIDIDGAEYKLTEMKGSDRDKWMKQMQDRSKFDPSGKPTGLKSFEGIHASLITLCLTDPAGNAVPEVVIKDWPAGLQSDLFKICQDMNGLSKEAAEAEKNS